MSDDQPLRILVHDLCGHPFPVQLSKELARRGHNVRHVFSEQFQTGKGDLSVPDTVRDNLEIVAVDSDRRFVKYNLVGRVLTEIRYGLAVARQARDFAPDVALTAQDPLISKQLLGRQLAKLGCRWVVWEQDLIYKMAERLDVGPTFVSAAVGRLIAFLERRALHRADHVVCITPDFLTELGELGVAAEKMTVIPNWAPIDEIVPLDRPTAWQIEHGLAEHRLLVYAGTLGMKHNPELLVGLADELRTAEPDVRIVVVSEGLGADYLHQQIADRGLDNLLVLPFQPYELLSEVLGSATGLLVILEADAGSMSVPSKLLSYLAAGRPIVAAVPSDNESHRQLAASGAGYFASPGSVAEFVAACRKLLASERLDGQGMAARRYAETHFGIEAIGDRFLPLLRQRPGGHRE